MSKNIDQHYRVSELHGDDSFHPGAGLLRLSQHNISSGTYWSGDFVDRRGIVTIQMESTFTRLDAVVGGRCHMRTWRRAFGERTLHRLCRAFLTDLAGEA